MALKTLVAVTDINNLSDARYCAGMGVDILSFNLSGDHLEGIKPEAVKEITGWLAGVQMAGAFSTGTSTSEINEAVQSCPLHFVQVGVPYLLDELKEIVVPIIFRIEITKDTIERELQELMELYSPQVQYFLIDSNDFDLVDETNWRFLKTLTSQFPVIIGFGITKENIQPVLDNLKPVGIALKGGHEIKPGLKNFDDLEEIFELLEE